MTDDWDPGGQQMKKTQQRTFKAKEDQQHLVKH